MMNKALTVLGLGLVISAFACSAEHSGDDGNNSNNNNPKAGSTTPAPTDNAPSTPAAPSPSSSSTDAPPVITPPPPPTVAMVKAFDAKSYELAEGLVLHKGIAYVGLAPLGQILAIEPSGQATVYATVPAGYTDGYTLGLAFDDADDTLFVLQTKNSATSQSVPGLYKVPAQTRGGGAASPARTGELFAQDERMTFPNGMVSDGHGGLLVTDSAAGKVFRVAADGLVTIWSDNVELVGTTACNAPLPFPMGANGISYTPASNELFVTNTANGTLIGIGVLPDGSAGAARVLTKDCANAGFDGVVQESATSFLVAQNGAPGRVVRVSMTGVVTDIEPKNGLLDGPASLAIGDWNGKRTALVTNSAFFSASDPKATPHPSLIAIGPLP